MSFKSNNVGERVTGAGGAGTGGGGTGGGATGEISQSLPIPEYKMGWIIGKKGSYINQLAKKSGAEIVVSDNTSKEYGTVWKYVQVTGTGRAVDRAKKLIHIRLERLEPREDDGGNDADGNGDNTNATSTSADLSSFASSSSNFVNDQDQDNSDGL